MVRTVEGPGPDQFVTVFAGAPRGQALVKGVRLLPLPAGAPEDAIAVEVATTAGTDVVVSMLTPRSLSLATSLGEVVTDGRLAAVLGSGSTPAAACLVGGTKLSAGTATLRSPAASYSGQVSKTGRGRGESHFVLEGSLDTSQGLIGHTLLIQDGAFTRAYPIRHIGTDGRRTTVYTKRDGVGFEARPGATWEFLPVVSWRRR